MGNGFDYEDEFARADAREKQLQRQLNMKDGANIQSNANGYYQNNGQYDGYDYSPFYDKKGNPISSRSARHLLTGLSVMFFVLALFLAVLMFVIVHSMRQSYARCSVEVQGVIVDNVISRSGNESTYFPVIRFEYKGREYEQKSDSGSYPAKYETGQVVTVHINPDNPKELYIEKDDSTVISGLSVISGAFLVLGIMLVIVSVKSKRNERNSVMM